MLIATIDRFVSCSIVESGDSSTRLCRRTERRRRLAVVLFGWRPHRHAIGAPFDLWVRNPTITGRVTQDELRSEHCYAAFAAGMSVDDGVVAVPMTMAPGRLSIWVLVVVVGIVVDVLVIVPDCVVRVG